MDLPEFVMKVRDMRTAQIEYFRSRDPLNLSRSKRLEKEVDAELQMLTGQRPGEKDEVKHPTLF